MARQNFTLGQPVTVSLFDKQITNQPGTPIGIGKNTAGEDVWLVEMQNPSSIQPANTHVGASQLQHGKKLVLACYPEEIQPQA